MRVTITAGGSRGDLEPVVALAGALQQRGHRVKIAAAAEFERLVVGRCISFAPVTGKPRQDVEALAAEGLNFVRFGRRAARIFEATMEANVLEYAEACADAEAIIYTPVGFWGYLLAEVIGAARVGAELFPLFCGTASYPCAAVVPPTRRLPAAARAAHNRASYPAGRQVLWQPARAAVTRTMRRPNVGKLGLRRPGFFGPFHEMAQRPEPILNAWSRHVLPEPQDWPPQWVTTGYCFLDPPAGWKPPEDLVAFLADGPPPISVGFGSMTHRHTEALLQIVLDAVAKASLRAVLLTGWGGLHGVTVPETVYVAEELPHAWLFPRVSLALHHGGAGTVAAALRAGIPSVTVPFFGDQPFWGSVLRDLGTAPPPIARDRLSPERLAAALSAAGHASARERAAELGRKIGHENGAATAAEAFDRFAFAV